MSILLALVLFVLLFLVFISMIILVIGPVMLLQPYRRTKEYYRKHTSILHPDDLGLSCESLTLKTAEGLQLSCWLVPSSVAAKGTIIYLHGVSECKIVGLPLAQQFHNQGYNVFLYDSRRHGDSGGTFCTYGFYEKHDVSTIISHLERRSDLRLGKVGLFGTSMGAAVALQVAAVDPRIAAVVAESGFATLRSIFDDYQKRMIKLPWHYLRNIVIKRSEHIAHFKANAVSPLDAVREMRVPLFILHGTADDLIASTYSEMVYRNAHEPKQLWLIEGARHDNMAEVGGNQYYTRILTFFNTSLS
jgi:alpha-beta hydrolase superfamily lysophospholipase